MGWFKSLFRKEEELRKAYVEIEQLQQWFDSRSEVLIENIKESIKEDMESINDGLSQIKKASKALEEAKLRNDKIPERAIHIMEGNRKAYINSVLIFAGRISTPSAISFKSVSEFVSAFEDTLSNFTKASAKNYHILQEFFANESGAIAKRIKDIDLTVRGLLDNDYKKINSITGNIAKVSDILKKKETAEIMLSDQEKERFEVTQQIDETKQKIEEIRKSRDYKFYNEAKKSKEEVAKQIKDVEKALFELFAPLDRPMRKYAKIAAEGEKLLTEYSKSPLKALTEDRAMNIMNVMAKMKTAAENGQLGLKDKAKEKAIKQIDMIKSSLLKNHLDEYDKLTELHAEKERSLKMNTVLQRQNEAEYKLNHLKDKLAKIDQNVEKLSRFLEMPDMEETLGSIRKDVRDTLNTDLRIKIDNRLVGNSRKTAKEK